MNESLSGRQLGAKQGPTMDAFEEICFYVDLSTGEAEPIVAITLASVGLKERDDLQRWISTYPEIVGPDLLLVTTEFDQWQIREQKVKDRLDVLFLDSDGAPLVAELKRGRADDTTELQALKYAAYCSRLTVEDVMAEYSRYHKVDTEAARAAIVDHAPALSTGELAPIRVRLVAGGFGPSVTHVVLWLRELELDIGCIQVEARQLPDRKAIVIARQLLPPPAAEDYLVKVRRREQEEDERGASTRRRNTVTVLTETNALTPGAEVRLGPHTMPAEWRAGVEALLEAEPEAGIAEWTGLGLRNALRWRRNGKTYSCTGLVYELLAELGIRPTAVAGTDHWLAPTGESLYELALRLEPQAAESLEPLANAIKPDETVASSGGGTMPVPPKPAATQPG
jgi:hypothetical protein